MYGTVFRIQPKLGTEEEIIRLMEQWDRERRPKVKGVVATYLYRLDQGGMMGAVVFQDKETYEANANDPEQDRWYRRLRELLEADPEWNDGEIVVAYTK